jgi:hypothetical protein
MWLIVLVAWERGWVVRLLDVWVVRLEEGGAQGGGEVIG